MRRRQVLGSVRRARRHCLAPTIFSGKAIEIVRSASEVRTDRLHCMLSAVMPGKPTLACPTAYGKLEGVYEHGVKPWAEVTFVRV